ncbi:unnamed protein product [Orchesella dallaii]|uniref:Neurotransmitter-gated ion-channel transmembrane domain-containing protein n=1 Tax=Orchesella dallaii TaxID=48710 RepID=A0ABP1QCA0_9HEXA
MICINNQEKYQLKNYFHLVSHTINDQVFHWDDSLPLAIDPNINLPNFNIGTTSTGIHLREYFPGKFHCVEVVFELRRKLGHHVFHTYIPSALMVALSLLSFWIRAEVTAVRITVCVTSLLILGTQNVIQSLVILPKVPCIKAIDVWMWFCTAIAIVALLEFALVNQFIEKGYQQGKNSFGDIYELDTTADLQSQIQFAGSTLSDYTPSLRKNNRMRNLSLKLDKISRFLFPIAFFIFNIVYWSIVLI